MLNDQTLKAHWDQIVGQLRARWEALRPEDLQAFQGNVEQLVALIQSKTGEAREAIVQVLDRLTADPAQAMREGYVQAEEAIRRRPGEAAAICFGAGLAVGVLLGLVLRSR
jgi:uncharacterized protein YjbJ (UPF0337 family)